MQKTYQENPSRGKHDILIVRVQYCYGRGRKTTKESAFKRDALRGARAQTFVILFCLSEEVKLSPAPSQKPLALLAVLRGAGRLQWHLRIFSTLKIHAISGRPTAGSEGSKCSALSHFCQQGAAGSYSPPIQKLKARP